MILSILMVHPMRVERFALPIESCCLCQSLSKAGNNMRQFSQSSWFQSSHVLWRLAQLLLKALHDDIFFITRYATVSASASASAFAFVWVRVDQSAKLGKLNTNMEMNNSFKCYTCVHVKSTFDFNVFYTTPTINIFGISV